MFNTTEEAISSPLPSPQATSPRAFSDQPQGRLPNAHLPHSSPSHGTHASHLRYAVAQSFCRKLCLHCCIAAVQFSCQSQYVANISFHFITYGLGCGASSDSSDILA